TDEEAGALGANVLFTPALHATLVAWVERHYRDRLTAADLAAPALLDESMTALDELTRSLRLRNVYSFQAELTRRPWRRRRRNGSGGSRRSGPRACRRVWWCSSTRRGAAGSPCRHRSKPGCAAAYVLYDLSYEISCDSLAREGRHRRGRAARSHAGAAVAERSRGGGVEVSRAQTSGRGHRALSRCLLPRPDGGGDRRGSGDDPGVPAQAPER